MLTAFLPYTSNGVGKFYHRGSGNWLLVHITRTGEVTVCATLDDLTAPQSEAFIEYLRAEGFIAANDAPPTELGARQWGSERGSLHWLIDATWPDVDPTYLLHVRTLRLCALGVLIVWLFGIIVFVYF